MYDSVMLFLQALKLRLHYEDGEALRQQIRNSRIVECLGTAQLSKDSNERYPGDCSISNARYEEENDTCAGRPNCVLAYESSDVQYIK